MMFPVSSPLTCLLQSYYGETYLFYLNAVDGLSSAVILGTLLRNTTHASYFSSKQYVLITTFFSVHIFIYVHFILFLICFISITEKPNAWKYLVESFYLLITFLPYLCLQTSPGLSMISIGRPAAMNSLLCTDSCRQKVRLVWYYLSNAYSVHFYWTQHVWWLVEMGFSTKLCALLITQYHTIPNSRPIQQKMRQGIWFWHWPAQYC